MDIWHYATPTWGAHREESLKEFLDRWGSAGWEFVNMYFPSETTDQDGKGVKIYTVIFKKGETRNGRNN